MIKNNVPRDISQIPSTDPSDIIVGMNPMLDELTDIVLPKGWRSKNRAPFPLGGVVSFKLNSKQLLHMLICHNLGVGGWEQADRYVRIAMDHLWSIYGSSRYFSMVEIGKGKIGSRDGADHEAIHTAIANSWLSVDLYIFESSQPVAIQTITPKQLRAHSSWSPLSGVKKFAA